VGYFAESETAMSILETLPNNYKFTEQDVQRAMRTQFGEFVDPNFPEPTAEEWELSVLAMTADDMHRVTSRWPTVAEVLKYREDKEAHEKRQREERERRQQELCKLWGK
jgi:putative protein kinase ArgK-like GTPase of G3E family